MMIQDPNKVIIIIIITWWSARGGVGRGTTARKTSSTNPVSKAPGG